MIGVERFELKKGECAYIKPYSCQLSFSDYCRWSC